jgi:hypothetical protein
MAGQGLATDLAVDVPGNLRVKLQELARVLAPLTQARNIAETMPQERLDPEGAARAGAYAALIPEFLQPEDIAQLPLFLASDESRYINGAMIPAEAGWTGVHGLDQSRSTGESHLTSDQRIGAECGKHSAPLAPICRCRARPWRVSQVA